MAEASKQPELVRYPSDGHGLMLGDGYADQVALLATRLEQTSLLTILDLPPDVLLAIWTQLPPSARQALKCTSLSVYNAVCQQLVTALSVLLKSEVLHAFNRRNQTLLQHYPHLTTLELYLDLHANHVQQQPPKNFLVQPAQLLTASTSISPSTLETGLAVETSAAPQPAASGSQAVAASATPHCAAANESTSALSEAPRPTPCVSHTFASTSHSQSSMLQHNSLAQQLGSFLGQSDSLTELHASCAGHTITPEVMQALVGGLRSLRVLHLSNAKKVCGPALQALSAMTDFRHLSIAAHKESPFTAAFQDYQGLAVEVVQSLPSQLIALESLVLVGLNVPMEQPLLQHNMPSITRLVCDCHKMTRTAAKTLLRHMPNLQSLEHRSSEFFDMYIPAVVFKRFRGITELLLPDFLVDPRGVLGIATPDCSILHLTNLHSLEICVISPDALPPGSMPTVRVLKYGHHIHLTSHLHFLPAFPGLQEMCVRIDCERGMDRFPEFLDSIRPLLSRIQRMFLDCRDIKEYHVLAVVALLRWNNLKGLSITVQDDPLAFALLKAVLERVECFGAALYDNPKAFVRMVNDLVMHSSVLQTLVISKHTDLFANRSALSAFVATVASLAERANRTLEIQLVDFCDADEIESRKAADAVPGSGCRITSKASMLLYS